MYLCDMNPSLSQKPMPGVSKASLNNFAKSAPILTGWRDCERTS